MTPTPELRARVLGAVRAAPAPPRAVVQRHHALAFVLAFLPIIAFELYELHLGDRPLGFVVANVAGWSLLALSATWGAVGQGGSMLGRPRVSLVAIVLATPLLFLAIAGLGYVPWPQAAMVDCGGSRDVSCCALTLLLAIGPLLAFAFVRRESDPIHPKLSGAALGASAGAWAAVAMAMHCPISSLRHVLVAHVTPVVFFAVLGLLVGQMVVGVRARAT